MRRKRIALIGLRGAGKSTLGQALARNCADRWSSSTGRSSAKRACSLAKLFLLYGQAGYRRIERRCLERVIHSQERDRADRRRRDRLRARDLQSAAAELLHRVDEGAARRAHGARACAGRHAPDGGQREAMDDLQQHPRGPRIAVRQGGRASSIRRASAVSRASPGCARRSRPDAWSTDTGGTPWMPLLHSLLRRASSKFDYCTHPDRYRHWQLTFDGRVATLSLDVDENGRHPARLQAQAQFVRSRRGYRAARCTAAHPLRASRSAHASC